MDVDLDVGAGEANLIGVAADLMGAIVAEETILDWDQGRSSYCKILLS